MKLLVLAAALAACSKHHDPPPPGPAPFDELIVDLPPGTSDLSLDDAGTLWSISERDRVVAEIHLAQGSGAPAITRHPLDGVPDGLDTEALAWLGPGKLAIGTEGQTEATASVLFTELGSDGHFVVKRERPLTPPELGVALTNNHGVEAMCAHGDDVLVAIETIGKRPDGARWAPLVRLRGDAPAHVTKLWLTTDAGKISALSCTFAPDGSIDALAIERHYGVSRILRAKLPLDAAEATPAVALDLFPYNHDRLNLEGIVQLADGRWVLVNDNQGSRVDGPTELLFVHPR